jgi:DoxX-like protein
MSTAAQFVSRPAGKPGSLSKKSIWAGRILSGLVTAFLIFDAVIHLLRPPAVVQAFAQLHLPLSLAVDLGVIELVCIALYVIPRTAVAGAVFLTGYLGGAVAIQLTTSNSLFGEILFPVYTAAVLWGGLYLRDERVRALVPWHKSL